MKYYTWNEREHPETKPFDSLKWFTLFAALFAIWQNHTTGLDVKRLDKNLESTLHVQEQMLGSQCGELMFVEQKLIVPQELITGSPAFCDLFNVRNAGNDSIYDASLIWRPIYRPLPKEVPEDDQRMAIATQITRFEASVISLELVSPSETIQVCEFPVWFQICFDFPNVAFYGEVDLVWRLRTNSNTPLTAKYFYQAQAHDGSLVVHLLPVPHVRGFESDFVDPLFKPRKTDFSKKQIAQLR